MSWARYDDELPMNRKVGALLAEGSTGCAALGLHLLANTWARHNGTAGAIPDHQPGLLVGDTRLGRRLAALLATVGMFDAVAGGWQIHDFADYSDPDDDGSSAASRKARISSVRAAAGRKGGQANRKQTGSKPEAELEQLPSPVPVPVPVLAYISDDDDSVTTPGPSSSSGLFDPHGFVMAIAGLLAEERNDLANRRAWTLRTAQIMLKERAADIPLWHASGATPRQIADQILVREQYAPTPAQEAWYADLHCPDCAGDGWATVDEPGTGQPTFGPCGCRRDTPYEAIVHQLRAVQ